LFELQSREGYYLESRQLEEPYLTLSLLLALVVIGGDSRLHIRYIVQRCDRSESCLGIENKLVVSSSSSVMLPCSLYILSKSGCSKVTLPVPV